MKQACLKTLWSCIALVCWLGPISSVRAADSLSWRQDKDRVDAEIGGWDLPKLLENLASVTGWHIYLEPGSKHTVSTKFKDRPPAEALRLLLGDLSFALLPQTNGSPKLYVFRTSLQEATQLIRPAQKKTDPTAKPIPNELVVTLKPGANIDELAKKLGAKVVGRAKGSNTFRLAFDTADAAQS